MDLSMQKILAYSLDSQLTSSKLRETEDFSDFFSSSQNQSKSDQLQSRMNQYWVRWILENQSDFPFQFSSTKNPPAVIYAMWNLNLIHQHILWIVWPRDMSQYGDQVMQALFHQIFESWIVTVSWMARGVDHLCHQLSIAYHLPTIAILWWWLRYYRNSSARWFMQQILDNWGLILSEFKLDFKPTPRSFPQRNRLIAWLSEAIFLPEAREWSWSLITADFAYQQHKPIFVAPNPLFSENGIWSNHLVSSGKASLLSDFGLILKLFWIKNNDSIHNKSDLISNSVSYDNLLDCEKQLLQIVSRHSNEDFSFWMNEISDDFWEAMQKLTDLEMNGLVSQTEPGIYVVNV